MYKMLQYSGREIKEISFDSNTEHLKQDYLDIFEDIKSDAIYTTQYHKKTDIGTT